MGRMVARPERVVGAAHDRHRFCGIQYRMKVAHRIDSFDLRLRTFGEGDGSEAFLPFRFIERMKHGVIPVT
jgi:hypothetical protein